MINQTSQYSFAQRLSKTQTNLSLILTDLNHQERWRLFQEWQNRNKFYHSSKTSHSVFSWIYSILTVYGSQSCSMSLSPLYNLSIYHSSTNFKSRSHVKCRLNLSHLEHKCWSHLVTTKYQSYRSESLKLLPLGKQLLLLISA